MSSDLARRLVRPEDIASRALFRVLFGLVAAAQSYRLVADGHAATLWVEPTTPLPWPGLAWLAPHAGEAIFVQLYLQILLALAIAVGAMHRLAGALLALGCISLLAREQTACLAELQLTATLALLLAFTPADRALSLDAWLRPERQADTAPVWSLWLLRGQLAVVLFCVGVSMLDGDWLRGYPLRLWLPDRQGLPGLGALSGSPAFAVALSWALAIMHLAAPALLVWRRSRPWLLATLALALFWLEENFFLGAWPWLLLVGSTLFLEPGWPRRVLNWPSTGRAREESMPGWVMPLLSLWLTVQVAVPLRGLVLPGPVAWNERGAALAWRVPGPSKGGAIQFRLRDTRTGHEWEVDPSQALSERQVRGIATSPALARRYARRLGAVDEGAQRLEVRASGLVTLNGRQPQRLLDPAVDLNAEGPLPGAWVLPLEIPLAQQWRGGGDWSPPRDELAPAP